MFSLLEKTERLFFVARRSVWQRQVVDGGKDNWEKPFQHNDP